MNDTPTPRTDKAEVDSLIYGKWAFDSRIGGNYCANYITEFARELERELIQSQKSTINLRIFIQELESVQQGLINQVQELNEANAGLSAELAKAQFGNTASPFCK